MSKHINEYDYLVGVPGYDEPDKVFIKNTFLGMAPTSSLYLHVSENEEVGLEVVRINEDTFVIREAYYGDEASWRLIDCGHDSIFEVYSHFEAILEMHKSDSKEE